ncbi:MAG: GntR family transcriptional regulator [Phenylobacterium sp.]|uniref:GntR family transcriptional regulator n=1 Tax=Phenylobacterium sp. TaxID=1871053 RepID=UPI00391A0CD5
MALSGRRSEPYLRARSALLDAIRAGDYLQGQPLKAAEIAQHLQLSPTPVREALAYLAGAGLIAEERGVGYRGARPDADDLADLFHLQTIYLTAVVRAGQPPAALTGADLAPAALAIAELQGGRERMREQVRFFANLVRRGESPALTDAYGRLCEQLAPFREAEAAVFRDEAATWRDVAEHLRREDWGAATAWLQEHGQRRRGGAGRILAIARSQVLANSSGISTL